MYIVVLLSYILGWVSWTEIIGGDCGGHGPFIVVRAEPEGDEGYVVVWRNKTYIEPRCVAWALWGGCDREPKGNVKYSDIGACVRLQ